MKTGFLYGGARTPRYVYYYYHGKILQCRKEPWIPPYIYYDTHPAEYPPNYYYECDTMPDGATPPMSSDGMQIGTIVIHDGLFDYTVAPMPGYGQTAIRFVWHIMPERSIELTALFPTMEVPDLQVGFIRVTAFLAGASDLAVRVTRKRYRTWQGDYINEEYTTIYKERWPYCNRPYTNNIHILFEKILGTNKWNFYFNDEWIFDITNPHFYTAGFGMSGSTDCTGHATMDYLRVWKDKERF